MVYRLGEKVYCFKRANIEVREYRIIYMLYTYTDCDYGADAEREIHKDIKTSQTLGSELFLKGFLSLLVSMEFY